MKVRLCLQLTLFLSVAAFTSSGARSQTPTASREKPTGVVTARLDGFVNWDFRHRKQLKGWRTTALVIERTLSEWYPRSSAFLLRENQPPDELRKFLATLPTRRDCALSLVYLASHQSPAGEWDFTQRHIELLSDLVAQAKPAEH